MIRSLLYFLEQQGLDTRALSRDAGLSAAVLADRDRRINSHHYTALMQAGICRTGDPLLGLRFGSAVEPDRWGVLGVLVSHCRNVGEAALVSASDSLALRWTAPASTPPALTEEALAAYVSFGRWATGRSSAPERVHFRHAPQAKPERYERFLACPVVFNQPCDELVLSPAVLDMPLRNPDADLRNWLARRARRLEKSLDADGIQGRLGRWLAGQLPLGVPTLEQTAAALELAPRTLQRELTGAGTSFTGHLTEVRRELADHYLRDPSLDIGDIGVLLGFSEQSAFQRAFKRWHGVTPRVYRRRLAS